MRSFCPCPKTVLSLYGDFSHFTHSVRSLPLFIEISKVYNIFNYYYFLLTVLQENLELLAK